MRRVGWNHGHRRASDGTVCALGAIDHSANLVSDPPEAKRRPEAEREAAYGALAARLSLEDLPRPDKYNGWHKLPDNKVDGWMLGHLGKEHPIPFEDVPVTGRVAWYNNTHTQEEVEELFEKVIAEEGTTNV